MTTVMASESPRKGGARLMEQKKKKKRPTHFVAIQITNQEIHDRSSCVQQSIIKQEPLLAPAAVNLATLHFTLMVMELQDKPDVARAKSALNAAREELVHLLPEAVSLEIRGMGNFGNRVVFAKVHRWHGLEDFKIIAETVQTCMAWEGIFSTDNPRFKSKPHLTLMKLSNAPDLKEKGFTHINSELYQDHVDKYFGTQRVDSLQLCEMGGAPDDYYPILHQVALKSPGPRKGGARLMEQKKKKKRSPTHFVAIQITNQEIHDRSFCVQQSIIKQEPLLEPAAVNLVTLHFTLMVMELQDESDVERAKFALDAAREELVHLLPEAVSLEIRGMGNFGNSVVFARVHRRHGLEDFKIIAERVQTCMARKGIFSTDNPGFKSKPHLTLMKLSNDPDLKEKGIKNINSAHYQDHMDTYFGTQLVDSLQLCEMGSRTAPDDYYPILHQVALSV